MTASRPAVRRFQNSAGVCAPPGKRQPIPMMAMGSTAALEGSTPTLSTPTACANLSRLFPLDVPYIDCDFVVTTMRELLMLCVYATSHHPFAMNAGSARILWRLQKWYDEYGLVGSLRDPTLADKARRRRIPPVFEGGATPTARVHRSSNVDGRSPRAVNMRCTGRHTSERATTRGTNSEEIHVAAFWIREADA